MAMEIARLLASPEGMRLVQSQGLPMDVVLRQSVEHMERLEALALYQRHLEGAHG